MVSESQEETDIDIDIVCNLLDKLTLKQLYLMEDVMHCEINIESSINKGSFHLAKSRYIMGQSSVSATKLPMENSAEFSAATICKSTSENGIHQLNVVDNEDEDIVNPIRWFGVLVPQSLYKAQILFKNSINYVVECVNVHLQLNYTMDMINLLKCYKQLKG